MGRTLTRRIHSWAFPGGLKLTQCVGGPQGFVVIRAARYFELLREMVCARCSVEIAIRPAEHSLCKMREVGYLAMGSPSLSVGSVLDKAAVIRSNVLIDASVRIKHRRDGDDETDGLDVSQPLLVRENCRVFRHGLSRSRPEVHEADGFNTFGADFVEGTDALRF